MDYKNEFEGIIEAVKSEIRAQKSALQNEENSLRDAEGFEKAQSTAPKESDGAAAGASQDEQSFVSQEEGLLRGDDLSGGQNSGSQAAHLRVVNDKILNTARDEHLRTADGGDGRKIDKERKDGNFKISADAADEIYERLGSDIDTPPFAQAAAQNFTQNSAQSSKNSSPQNFTNDLPRSSQNSAQSAAENSTPALSSENVAVQDIANEFKEASESFDLAFKEFHEIESPQNSSSFGSKPNALGAESDQASCASASPQLSSASGARFSSQISSASRADARARPLGACEVAMEGANEISSEAEFLSALKERILVLFEGLNAFDQGDIEARVELNLKFMEFLLASIDDRLEHLSKR